METDTVVIPKLAVKTLTDRTIQVELAADIRNIGNLKASLARSQEVPIDRVLLLYRGRVLANNEAVPDPEQVIYFFYYEPTALAADPIDTASDWDTKNRMKVFKGLYLFSQRNFAEASPLLTDSLTTFSETNLMSFKDCVKYTIIAGILAMDRPCLYEKLIKSPEVLEVIEDLPFLKELINSLYDCRYTEFFKALVDVEDALRSDWLAAPHLSYIIKELRIRAYGQILQSYRSLTLTSMAKAFGVSLEFIDSELSRFIAANRLNCVIDKVAGLVITNPPDQRNSEYLAIIKQGDALMSRMQKLLRIVSY